MSPTQKAINRQGKIQKYLMGYVAGYILDEVVGDNVFYIMDNTPVENFLDKDFDIFLTKDAALNAISNLDLSKPRKRFVRPYFYSTDIPKHAKWYKLISDCSPKELEKIEFVK